MNRTYAMPPAPKRRQWLIAVVAALALALVAAAAWMPWHYPSSSLLYKFGTEKVLLRIGKSMGTVAVVLLVFQVLLVARLRWIERILGQNRLIALHRWLGLILAGLILAHPLFVFAPEDLRAIPPNFEYWPEIVGAILLVLIVMTAGFAHWRDFMALPHHIWKPVHRWSAPLLAAMLVIHVLYVNDGYQTGLPRVTVIAAAGVFFLLWLRIAIRPLRRVHLHRISAVAPSGRDAVTLALAPVDGRPIAFAPGQFAYLRLHDGHLPREEHPFSLASRPGDPNGLQVTIRCAGDWTERIGQVQPGDLADVQGPYGLFTPLAFAPAQRLVLIAGGVGITPMLSMLRTLAEKGDRRPSTLIWSNRTRADRIHADEIADLQRRLTGLSVIHRFTRETNQEATGRIDLALLKNSIGPYRQGTLLFLCGPNDFMKQIRTYLKRLGYPDRTIKSEAFRM